MTTKHHVPREITARLARLRWYIRGYLCARGLALVLAAVAAAFWVSLALDWLWEPTAAVRIALLGLAVLAIGCVMIRSWLAHLLVPLSDRNMAMLLERSDSRLDDRLLTVVELTGRQGPNFGFDDRMLAHTGDEARSLIAAVRPLNVLNFRPLMWALALAVLTSLTVVLLHSIYPQTFDTWVRRSLLMGPQRWERDTLISVEGFPADSTGRRSIKVAVGGDLDVRALADTSRRIPGKLDLTYYGPDGARLTQSMTKEGTAVPPRDPYQEYFYSFKNIQNTICLSVRAQRERLFDKDDVVENLWIDAVESPALDNLSLRCTYPVYTRAKGQEPEDVLAVTGIMPIPEGTQVVVEASATKGLASVQCQIAGEQTKTKMIAVPEGGRQFQLPLGSIRRNTVVSMTLTDTDGVSNRQPARLQIRVVPDQAPQIDVRLADIGKAITPRARLPLRGTIADDYGLSKTWFEFLTSLEMEQRGKDTPKDEDGQAGPKQPRQQSFAMPANGRLSAESGVALDVSSLELRPGSRFYLWVKGADACPLDAEPHVGSSPRIDLDVVTEQQLRGMLEGTELVLRRRFEGIMADLRRTGDSLHRIETDGAPADSGQADLPAAKHDGRSQSRASIRVAEALERCGWSTHETHDVADQFQRILNELENNRVEHLDEQRSRLGDRIVLPLREIVRSEFPQLKNRLQQLQRSLADDGARRLAATEAEKQLDAVLRQMDQILAEMVESEGFNELLAQLRVMIQSHDDVVRLTRERQQQLKKQLREGLE